jgi:hypothetical protein
MITDARRENKRGGNAIFQRASPSMLSAGIDVSDGICAMSHGFNSSNWISANIEKFRFLFEPPVKENAPATMEFWGWRCCACFIGCITGPH